MYEKSFGLCVILCFIKLVLFVYVSGKPLDSEEKTVSIDEPWRWKTVAQNVCWDLEYINKVSLDTCQKNVYKSRLQGEVKKVAPVKIRCMTRYNIVYQIEPSRYWQLVVLIPEQNNDDIIHSLVEPNKEYGEISIEPDTNFTLWSTELVEGSALEWQGGDKVPQYQEMPLSEQREYEVKVKFLRKEDKNVTVVNGLITWNVSDEADVCFHIINICKDTDLQEIKIWPDSKPEVLLTNLSLNDKCSIQVKGLYGSTEYEYQTPLCDHSNCVAGGIKPEIPQDVEIEVTEDTSNTWQVRVTWSPPQLVVDRYNITLRSHDIQTLVLDGDATEAVFKGVTGEGMFNVSVYAILGRWAAHTSRRAILPGAGGRAGAARGVALGAGAAAAAALAALCLWRWPRRRPPTIHYPPAIKPSKENDIEATSMTLETEDSWEIRSDKLLLHEVIGEGAFGVVRRATLAPNGTNVAVKMLKDFPSLEEIRSFHSEMELMKSVGQHPHLVSLVGCCTGRRPLIVAEYCSRGDLLTYLRCTWDVMVSKRNAKYYNNNIDTSDYRNDLFKCKMQMENSKLVVNKLYELQEICDKELTSLDLLSFCRQIAMGMEFLAANRVVHRDLAARNILVTADRTLKIADFGLSRDVYEENQYKQKGNGKMPVKWMALESLTRRIYTTQSDVWSFGVVVWEVATVGAAPYASVPATRLPRLLRAGYRMPRPANCSPQLYDIMLSCWRSSPRERPTFGALHARLDELLNSASAHHYLSLELEPSDAPPSPKHHRYIKMFIRGKRNYWSRSETYERPLKPIQSNHYTTPPITLTKTPPV